MEDHRLGNLDSHVFLTVLKAGNFRIEGPADLVIGKSTLPGLQTTVFSYPHGGEQRERAISLTCILERGLIPPMRILPLWPNYPPKVPPSHIITLGLASTYEFWGQWHSVHSSPIYSLSFLLSEDPYLLQHIFFQPETLDSSSVFSFIRFLQ